MLVALPEVIAAILLCVWGLWEPFAGVLGMLVFIVGQPEQVFSIVGALHVEKIFGVLILIRFLMLYQGRIRLSPMGGWLLAFYAAVLFSLPLAIWKSNAIANATDFGKIIILAFLIINVVDTPKRLRIFLLCYALLLGYMAVSGMVNFYLGSAANHYYSGDLDRLVGLTSDSNAPDSLAISLAASLPLLAIFMSRGKWIWRLAFVAIGLACFWSMLLTGTRTALYCLVVAGFIYILRSRKRVKALVAMAVVFIGLWAFLPNSMKARYLVTLSAQGRAQDLDYTLRLMSWEGGWHMFLSNPLTGIGMADYNAANGVKYWPGAGHKQWFDAHSLFFKILGELGLFGLVTFTGLITSLVRTNARLRRILETGGGDRIVPAFLKAANYIVLILLLVGYGAHDLYRSTWYILAALTGAVLLQTGAQPQTHAAPASPAVAPRPLGVAAYPSARV